MEAYILMVMMMLFLIVVVVFMFVMNNKLSKEFRESLDKSYHHQEKELFDIQLSLNKQFLDFQDKINETLNINMERSHHKIQSLEKNVNEGLFKGFDNTNQAFNSMNKELISISKTQENLDSLSNNINELQKVLVDKKSRGAFGEMELYTILKSAFGINDTRYQKQFKLSNGRIADAIIKAPDPLGYIAVDSKFPLENYNRMVDDSLTTEEQEKGRRLFVQDIKKHLKDISSRYIIAHETADLAFMFVPSEAIFAEIYGHHLELIELSHELKVFIVSPTTLMAYLTAVQSIYLDQQRNEKVVEIQKEYQNLSVEFSRFKDRFDKVIKDFDRIQGDFKDVTITTEKIVKKFDDIENVKLEKEEQDV